MPCPDRLPSTLGGALFLVMLFTGCIDEPTYEGRACSASLPCPGDLQCVDATCTRLVERDGGQHGKDAGRPDAGDDGGVDGPPDAGDDGCFPCDAPPQPACSEDDDTYFVFVETAECSTPGRCEFTQLDFPCAGCAVNCLVPCAEIDCDELNDCRTAGYCAPAGAGAAPSCTYVPRPNGTLCTQEEGGEGHCAEGLCVPCADASDCDDQNECTLDQCDLTSGSCSHEPTTGSCNDGDACTQTDACEAGVCVGSDPIVCDQPTGPCQVSMGACSPADGSCSYPLDETICNDQDPCTIDTCEANGACTHAVAPDGSVCSDGDLCSVTDVCSGGVCVGTDPTICDSPPNECHEPAGTCDPGTGVCDYAFAADGSSCDDGDACTQADTCMTGMCIGAEVVCDSPPSPCHEPIGTCDPATGTCIYAPKQDGDSCDDGDACTYDDVCSNGTCAGRSITCNDTDCQIRSCNGTSQCTVTNRPSGYACTDDGNPCTTDTCNANGTCTHPNRSNGASCGSTANRRCCGGSCVNISTDESHCGGCFTACDSGFTCEPIESSPVCGSSYPANTSGRCRCQNANAHCPNNRGQVCRLTSYNDGNRCVPDSTKPSPCAPGQVIRSASSCPAYCAY